MLPFDFYFASLCAKCVATHFCDGLVATLLRRDNDVGETKTTTTTTTKRMQQHHHYPRRPIRRDRRELIIAHTVAVASKHINKILMGIICGQLATASAAPTKRRLVVALYSIYIVYVSVLSVCVVWVIVGFWGGFWGCWLAIIVIKVLV